jgi:hypothetical protein
MRRGLIVGIVAGVVLLALTGAALFYLLSVPDRLASSYKEDAEPEHEKIEKALGPVARSFSRRTFGEDTSEIGRAKRPGTYVRALERVTRRELKEIGPARRSIKRAERELEEIDEEAMTETPDWPLLGGRGDLKKAEEIAGEERDYLSKSRRFLREYRRLVDWASDRLRFYRRFGLTLGRGFGSIPENPSSPGQVTRPLERTADEIAAQARRFRRVKAPSEVRREHRNIAASVEFVVSEVRGLATAVRNLDLQRINQFDRRVTRGLRRYDRRSTGHFRTLIARSIYVRLINDVERRERQIGRAYDDF